jgi:hypothetical protein
MPVKFFVTCAASEVDASLRNLPNVVFAKDHKTTLLQDLALIRFSAFHLGSSSGPVGLVMFESKPYHIFNSDVFPHLPAYKDSMVEASPGELVYSFAQPLQTTGVVPETAAGIWHQFDKIWTSRDWAGAWNATGLASSMSRS